MNGLWSLTLLLLVMFSRTLRAFRAVRAVACRTLAVAPVLHRMQPDLWRYAELQALQPTTTLERDAQRSDLALNAVVSVAIAIDRTMCEARDSLWRRHGDSIVLRIEMGAYNGLDLEVLAKATRLVEQRYPGLEISVLKDFCGEGWGEFRVWIRTKPSAAPHSSKPDE